MITSTSNNKIKNIIKLCTSSKARREQNVFVAEGVKMFIEAPSARIREVYVSEEYLDKITGITDKSCLNKLENTGFETVSAQVFNKISDTVTPQGILCVIDREAQDIGKILKDHEGRDIRILAVENVRDPGNLGTMIRTMEAAGYDLMLASEGTVDVYNPKVIRSTMGSVYRVPVIYTDDLLRDIGLLKKEDIKVYAAHLKGEEYYDDITYGNRTAVLVGNEAKGLSEEAAGMADKLVKIPMQGQVESLNAAVAAALFLYMTRRK